VKLFHYLSFFRKTLDEWRSATSAEADAEADAETVAEAAAEATAEAIYIIKN